MCVTMYIVYLYQALLVYMDSELILGKIREHMHRKCRSSACILDQSKLCYLLLRIKGMQICRSSAS